MKLKALIVVATFKARRGQEAALCAALTALIEPAREEEGCLNYDLHVALDNKGHFMFHQSWISKAHLDAHLSHPPIQNLIPKLEKLCESTPDLKLWDKIV
jgi:quinol monooxygenase YgiN